MQAFAGLPLFENLTAPQLDLIGSVVAPFFCPSGETVFAQGDAASHLYLLISGTVAVRYKPEDGPPITLTHLSAGDAFGWSAVIGAPAYTSSVVASSPLEALRLPGVALRGLCRAHPELGRLILSRLADLVSPRWQHAGRQVEEILAEAIQHLPGESRQVP